MKGNLGEAAVAITGSPPEWRQPPRRTAVEPRIQRTQKPAECVDAGRDAAALVLRIGIGRLAPSRLATSRTESPSRARSARSMNATETASSFEPIVE